MLAASHWNRDVFESAGYRDVHYAPLGIETDIFNPWGPVRRLFSEKTYLWFSRNQHRKALDVTLKAWAEFHQLHADTRLIIMGVGVLESLEHRPDAVRRWKNLVIADYPEDGISVRETVTPLSDAELAILYRSVDFVISSSRSEGFGFVVAEAMACGTVPIFPGYGATREFGFDGALMIRGTEAPADYSDKGFSDVGHWWEPDVEHLASLLRDAYRMDATTRGQLTAAGCRLIRHKFTWRNTCFGLRQALTVWQEQAETPAPRSPVSGTPFLQTDTPLVVDVPQSQLDPVELIPTRSALRPGWAARNLGRLAMARREFAAVRREHGSHAAFGAVNRLVSGYTTRRAYWVGERMGVVRRPAPPPVIEAPAPVAGRKRCSSAMSKRGSASASRCAG